MDSPASRMSRLLSGFILCLLAVTSIAVIDGRFTDFSEFGVFSVVCAIAVLTSLLLVSLAAAFCALCLPFACFFMYVTAITDVQIKQDFVQLFLAHRIVRLLIFFNSFINPLLYAAQSANYRKAMDGICCCTEDVDSGRQAMKLINITSPAGVGEKVSV